LIANNAKHKLLNLKSPNDRSNFLSDGFGVTATEAWFKVKVEVIQSYLRAFVINVSVRADEILFVDLFTGNGVYSIGSHKEIFPGPAIASISSDLPISKWIVCERDPEAFTVLTKRIESLGSRKNVLVFDNALSHLPDKLNKTIFGAKQGRKIAVFCLIDPFNFEIPLAVVDSLASLGFSFLMPFTFVLNERVDHHYYLHEHPDKLLRYLGLNNFERLSGVQNNVQFYKRIVRMYQNRMMVMGLSTALSAHRLESRIMNIPAYYVGLFTRQLSAQNIQKEMNLAGQLELELFE
jgi:three-Cys-motif partner protein